MFRQSLFAAVALGSTLSVTPVSAESSTIRIEPRPYYGAVVTLEQGVRVWRPLPPTSHMIINPTGSPVNLSVADIRETVTHNIPPAYVPVPAAPSGAYVAPGAYGYPRYAPGVRQGRQHARPVPRRH